MAVGAYAFSQRTSELLERVFAYAGRLGRRDVGGMG